MPTLKTALADYVLYHPLSSETRDWYKRVASVYCRWHGCDPPLREFDGRNISLFLAAKQDAGRSPYYVKSLRNGLMAVLRAIRGDAPVERVRSIKCPPLDPEAWTGPEVERLLSPGCDYMPEAARDKWRLAIELAYYLGLDRCDLERLEQTSFADNGALIHRRQKTGAAPNSGIPLDLLAIVRERCPRRGPICRMGVSPEWFRRIFARIVARAGLFGSFKRLRKSSGSLVEKASPGSGHKHLGNSRLIFEKHYESKRITRSEPTMPPAIRRPPPGT